MYAVVVLFDIHPDQTEAFHALMIQNAKASLDNEPGCHQFDVCQNTDDPTKVFLYETYTDRAAFDDHLTSDHFKAFDEAVADMIAGKRIETFETVVS